SPSEEDRRMFEIKMPQPAKRTPSSPALRHCSRSSYTLRKGTRKHLAHVTLKLRFELLESGVIISGDDEMAIRLGQSREKAFQSVILSEDPFPFLLRFRGDNRITLSFVDHYLRPVALAKPLPGVQQFAPGPRTSP